MADLIFSGRFEVGDEKQPGGIAFLSSAFYANPTDLDGQSLNFDALDGVGVWSVTFDGREGCYFASTPQPTYNNLGYWMFYAKKRVTPASSGIVNVEIFKHSEFDYLIYTSSGADEFNGFCYYSSGKRLLSGTTLMGKPRPDIKTGDEVRVTSLDGGTFELVVSSAIETSERFENGLELQFPSWTGDIYAPFAIENLSSLPDGGEAINLLKVGDTPISDAFVGDAPVSRIYAGETLVYGGTPTPPPFAWTAGVYPTKDGEFRFYRATGGMTIMTFAKVPDVEWKEGADYHIIHSKMGDLGTNTLLGFDDSVSPASDARLTFAGEFWGTEGNGIFEVGTTMTLEEV